MIKAAQLNNTILTGFLGMATQIDTQDNEGKTALMYSVINGNFDFAKDFLIELSGANPSIKDNQGMTAADYAAQHPPNTPGAQEFIDSSMSAALDRLNI